MKKCWNNARIADRFRDQPHDLGHDGVVLAVGQRAAQLLKGVRTVLDRDGQLEIPVGEKLVPLGLGSLDAHIVTVSRDPDLHVDDRPLVKIEVVGRLVKHKGHVPGKKAAVPVVFELLRLRAVEHLLQLLKFFKSL